MFRVRRFQHILALTSEPVGWAYIVWDEHLKRLTDRKKIAVVRSPPNSCAIWPRVIHRSANIPRRPNAAERVAGVSTGYTERPTPAYPWGVVISLSLRWMPDFYIPA
jgi:hypothetical protein